MIVFQEKLGSSDMPFCHTGCIYSRHEVMFMFTSLQHVGLCLWEEETEIMPAGLPSAPWDERPQAQKLALQRFFFLLSLKVFF